MGQEACYNFLASDYDQLVGHSDFYANLHQMEMRTLKAVLKKHHAGRALDMGCGTGDFAIVMAQAGLDTLGIDISSQMLSVARGKANATELPVSFETLDVMDVDKLDGRFSVVTAFGSVINHIEAEQWSALVSKIAARLERGGLLLLSCDNLLGIDSWTWAFYKGLLERDRTAMDDFRKRRESLKSGLEVHRNEWPFRTPRMTVSVHLYYHSIRRISKWLKNNHLEIIEVRGANISSTLQRSVLYSCYDLNQIKSKRSVLSHITQQLDIILSRILWRSGANVIFVARKSSV